MSLISKWQLGIWSEMRDVAPGPYQHRLITWLCKWISENVSFSYLFRQKAWISSLKVSAELTSTYRLNRCCFFLQTQRSRLRRHLGLCGGEEARYGAAWLAVVCMRGASSHAEVVVFSLEVWIHYSSVEKSQELKDLIVFSVTYMLSLAISHICSPPRVLGHNVADKFAIRGVHNNT